MRHSIWASVIVLSVCLAGQAVESDQVFHPSVSPEMKDFFTATGAMATRLVLGEVDFRGPAAALPVQSYQLVGKTTFHPFAPDTPTPTKLTDAFRPDTTSCPAGGPWVGFADTVKHVTVEFDLGAVGEVEAFALTYLVNVAPAAQPDRVRFFASIDGKFAGQNWGTDSDTLLPVPDGSYFTCDFPAGSPAPGARQATMNLPRPIRARYVRLVFSYDITPNLVLSDYGQADLSQQCASSNPLWSSPNLAGENGNTGPSRPDGDGGPSGSPIDPGPSPQEPRRPSVHAPEDPTDVPEPVTAALLTLGALTIFPRRRATPARVCD